MKITCHSTTTTTAAVFLLLCVLHIGASAAHASRSTEARQAIKQAFAQVEAAIKRGDLNTAISFYAPNYKTTDVNGRSFNLNAEEKRLHHLITSGMKNVSYTLTNTIEECKVEGNVATVRMRVVDRQTNFPTPQHSLYFVTFIQDRSYAVDLGGVSGSYFS